MKLTVKKESLASALGNINRTIPARNTIPILANVRLTADGDTLKLTGTDLDIQITDSITCSIESAGDLTVPAALLFDIVRKFPANADVSLELKETTVIVKCGRSRFTLNYLPAVDFPELDLGTGQFHRFDVPAATLAKLLQKIGFAISTEETRYYLNGIYLHVFLDGNRHLLRGVATDGHRLGVWQFDAPAGALEGDKMPGVIVPRKTVELVGKMLVGKESVGVAVSNMKIIFTIGPVQVVSKLIDGTFPDYRRVIPEANSRSLVMDKAAFMSAVDRVVTVSGDSARRVAMTCAEGEITFRSSSPDHGEATEDMPAEFSGAELVVGFNGRYLNDIGKHIGGEKIRFDLEDAGSPALIKDPDDADGTFVLMPMRV